MNVAKSLPCKVSTFFVAVCVPNKHSIQTVIKQNIQTFFLQNFFITLFKTSMLQYVMINKQDFLFIVDSKLVYGEL